MTIEYAQNRTISGEQLAQVFARSGIRRPVDDIDRMQRMLDGADVLVTAWDGERLVGVARGLCDFSYCCYLSDLAVDRAYQRQGIGRELIRRVQQVIGEECILLLLAAPEAMEYYPHIGFDKLANAWQLPRAR